MVNIILLFYFDIHENQMILDTGGTQIYVWTGLKANEEKKKKTTETAINYMKLVAQMRGSCLGDVVMSGQEPPQFTGSFHGWDYTDTAVNISHFPNFSLQNEISRK